MQHSIQKILDLKKNDIEKQQKVQPLEVLKKMALQCVSKSIFRKRLENASRKSVAVIAEIKLASPLEPMLGTRDEVLMRAVSYQNAGADAVSFITEEHVFKGDSLFIPRLKQTIKLPILQKDFVIDPYQIYEAKALGSDAILIIARFLTKTELAVFIQLANMLGVEPVVEVYDDEDLGKIAHLPFRFLAVNARDLETLDVSIQRACTVLRKVPDIFFKLGFSGIHSVSDVRKFIDAGARGVLIGTSLMKSKDNTLLTSLKI